MMRANWLLICGLLAAGPALAGPDAQALLAPCERCHGADGISSAPHIPHLNGQLANYLVDDLSALAEGRRSSAVPGHVPESWSIAEVRAVARYFEGQRAMRPPQPVSAGKVAEGEAIYQRRCAECHPDNGRGSEFDSPLLAAQNLQYLVNEIGLFLSGERKFVYKMDEAFRGLSREELESVAHFFASQPQY